MMRMESDLDMDSVGRWIEVQLVQGMVEFGRRVGPIFSFD